jgi:3-oxoacyl-[acyl-carrier-protein] synthase-1
MLGVPTDLDDDERAVLLEELGDSSTIQPQAIWFPYGRASTFAALAHASTLIERRAHRSIIVGGIDSLCGPHTVHRLVQFGRVLGPHTEGTIPGEAAVFTLLTAADDSLTDPSNTVRLEAIAHHRSAVPFTQRDRVSADDLAAVFRTLRQQGVARVERVIAAHSGEGYFGQSFAHAYLRELDIMPEPLEVELIADCVGDVGAAAGPLGLAFATYRMATEPRNVGQRALVYSESDTGEVGAAIIDGMPRSWEHHTAAGRA